MKKGDSVLAEVTSLNCAAYTALKDSGISVRLHMLPSQVKQTALKGTTEL